MYDLTTFLAGLWHTVAGWLGVGRNEAHAVSWFNGADRSHLDMVELKQPYWLGNHSHARDEGEGTVKLGFDFDLDLRYTHPHGWGLDSND
jgi:hypothetical protein